VYFSSNFLLVVYLDFPRDDVSLAFRYYSSSSEFAIHQVVLGKEGGGEKGEKGDLLF
jgi:hypothetical protein